MSLNGKLEKKRKWGYGSVGRASRSQREGREFESHYLHQKKDSGLLSEPFLYTFLYIII